MTTRRKDARRPLGTCSLLTVGEAIAELAMTDQVARQWLRDQGLICLVASRRRVVAGDLVDAIRNASREGRPPKRARRRALSLRDLPQADT
jgi:hypothetical protein